jgi:sortase A
VVAGYLLWVLWGTNFVAAHSQTELRQQFKQIVANPPSLGPGETLPQQINLPGGAYAELVIPKIHLDMIVVQGTSEADLAKGPGHYPQSADPWDPHGRVAIAGHRTTYLHPFWNLNLLTQGDTITLVTPYGTFNYSVTKVATVSPTDTSVTQQTSEPTLILTTCTPRFYATYRLVVFAVRR